MLIPKDIDVVILAGGQGSRLRGVESDLPKPMVDFHGEPFLNILLRYVASYGFRRFILCTGYRADYISNYYSQNSEIGEFIFSAENEPLGTGGAVKHAFAHVLSDTFLVLNGDSICRLDILQFLKYHKGQNAAATIAVAMIDNAKDYGRITMDEVGHVMSFDEKKESKCGYINAGLCLFERKIISLFPDKTSFSLETEFFPKIIGKGFYGYLTNEPVVDIGTPERLALARQILQSHPSSCYRKSDKL